MVNHMTQLIFVDLSKVKKVVLIIRNRHDIS
jgi:hypothetical protein